jgi:sugar phosphate isomerase/epimerase
MKDFKCEFRPPGFTAVLTFPKLLAGDVNFPLVMKELRAIGFDGALVSEIDPGEGGYEETAATIREIMAM